MRNGAPFSKPRVRLYGATGDAQNYLGAAYNLLFKVRQFCEASGAPVFAMQHALEDGAVVQAAILGNEEIVSCFPPSYQRGVEEEKQRPPKRKFGGYTVLPADDNNPMGWTVLNGEPVSVRAYVRAPEAAILSAKLHTPLQSAPFSWFGDDDAIVTFDSNLVSRYNFSPFDFVSGMPDVFMLGTRITADFDVVGVCIFEDWLICISSTSPNPAHGQGKGVTIRYTASPRKKIQDALDVGKVLGTTDPEWEILGEVDAPVAESPSSGTVVRHFSSHWFFNPSGSECQAVVSPVDPVTEDEDFKQASVKIIFTKASDGALLFGLSNTELDVVAWRVTSGPYTQDRAQDYNTHYSPWMYKESGHTPTYSSFSGARTAAIDRAAQFGHTLVSESDMSHKPNAVVPDPSTGFEHQVFFEVWVGTFSNSTVSVIRAGRTAIYWSYHGPLFSETFSAVGRQVVAIDYSPLGEELVIDLFTDPESKLKRLVQHEKGSDEKSPYYDVVWLRAPPTTGIYAWPDVSGVVGAPAEGDKRVTNLAIRDTYEGALTTQLRVNEEIILSFGCRAPNNENEDEDEDPFYTEEVIHAKWLTVSNEDSWQGAAGPISNLGYEVYETSTTAGGLYIGEVVRVIDFDARWLISCAEKDADFITLEYGFPPGQTARPYKRSMSLTCSVLLKKNIEELFSWAAEPVSLGEYQIGDFGFAVQEPVRLQMYSDPGGIHGGEQKGAVQKRHSQTSVSSFAHPSSGGPVVVTESKGVVKDLSQMFNTPTKQNFRLPPVHIV